jgi:hypothetical protein
MITFKILDQTNQVANNQNIRDRDQELRKLRRKLSKKTKQMPKGLTMIRLLTPGKLLRDSISMSHQASPSKASLETRRIGESLSPVK